MKKDSKKYNINALKFGQILGIHVSSTHLSELLPRVEGLISHNQKFYILTPNPEIILMAQRNENLKNALNGTDLAIPDGVGLKIAMPGLNIIKGRELFDQLVKLAAGKGWRVFLLGGLGNEAELTARKLIILNLKLKIEYARGPRLDKDGEPVTEIDKKLLKDAIDRINKYSPQLLFVAFGNPNQEIWVHDNYSKLSIGGAMAVGGAFRYVAGQVCLPPKWMADIGLEWLWRLFTEPRRVGRIFNAVIVFPVKLFLYKLSR
jgi:N-acetylglucosaminyldiphosphoundecaprenol N-acetyl-beta-D-mannosaminyltransferase